MLDENMFKLATASRMGLKKAFAKLLMCFVKSLLLSF